MRDAADAEGPARTLALPPLSLSPRPSLAGAGAVAPHRLPGRAPTLPGGPAGLQQAAVGESRGESAGEPHSYRPGTTGGACRGGTLSALPSARRACSAIASISCGQIARGRSCPMPFDHHQRRAGDRPRRRPTARAGRRAGRRCRGSRAWARGSVRSSRGAVARGDDRRQLAPGPGRVVVAVVALARERRGSPPRRAASPASRSPSKTSPSAPTNASRSLGGPPQEQRVDAAARAARCAAAAGVGHDRDQRADLLGVAGGERLGDHPAHRGADDVRRREVELAQQAGGVLGHVGQRVVGGAAGAGQQLADRRRGARARASSARCRGCRSGPRGSRVRRARCRTPRASRSSARRAPSPAAPSGATGRRRSRSRG